jgi:hypothetical protein
LRNDWQRFESIAQRLRNDLTDGATMAQTISNRSRMTRNESRIARRLRNDGSDSTDCATMANQEVLRNYWRIDCATIGAQRLKANIFAQRSRINYRTIAQHCNRRDDSATRAIDSG